MSDGTQPLQAPTEGVRPIPPVHELTFGQYAGTHCVWCAGPLAGGTRYVGISRGREGAYTLDTEVWAGPCCP